MRLALVAMPWAGFDVASGSLGLLASVIREGAPGWSVDVHHAYVDVFSSIGPVYESFSRAPGVGELAYLPALWPDRREASLAALERWTGAEFEPAARPSSSEISQVVDALVRHADTLAGELADGYDVVGFTTTFAQFFSSLAAARRIKARSPGTTVVLGGVAVSWHIGPAVLDHFDFVDYVIQGEGEQRLLALLRAVEKGEKPGSFGGLLSRAAEPPARRAGDSAASPDTTRGASSEIADLDALPLPTYDDYAARAERAGIRWYVPIEGSRGCWWDRVKRTGDPMHACYFCGLNPTSYRQKSAGRIGEEMNSLAETYKNLRFSFSDSILRAHGVEEFARAITKDGRKFSFFYELRAQVTPWELLRLWEAGCDQVQFGIEGLSSGYLRRIGKGTTAIQNLQAMRHAYELGIGSNSNLLIDFPGSTSDEVDETARTIEHHAIAYEPCTLSRFRVSIDSTVYRRPEHFGVRNIRNLHHLAAGMPDELFATLPLFMLEHDADTADWTPVVEAVAKWRRLHERLSREASTGGRIGAKPLHYNDGGTFLEIVDRRREDRTITLEGAWRSVYLYCTRIRTRGEIRARFAGEVPHDELDEILDRLVDEDLCYREGQRFLSLAVAARIDVAIQRIREAHAREHEEERRSSTRREPISVPTA